MKQASVEDKFVAIITWDNGHTTTVDWDKRPDWKPPVFQKLGPGGDESELLEAEVLNGELDMMPVCQVVMTLINGKVIGSFNYLDTTRELGFNTWWIPNHVYLTLASVFGPVRLSNKNKTVLMDASQLLEWMLESVLMVSTHDMMCWKVSDARLDGLIKCQLGVKPLQVTSLVTCVYTVVSLRNNELIYGKGKIERKWCDQGLHTAPTLPGFSGSPLVSQNKVIGFNLGATNGNRYNRLYVVNFALQQMRQIIRGEPLRKNLLTKKRLASGKDESWDDYDQGGEKDHWETLEDMYQEWQYDYQHEANEERYEGNLEDDLLADMGSYDRFEEFVYEMSERYLNEYENYMDREEKRQYDPEGLEKMDRFKAALDALADASFDDGGQVGAMVVGNTGVSYGQPKQPTQYGFGKDAKRGVATPLVAPPVPRDKSAKQLAKEMINNTQAGLEQELEPSKPFKQLRSAHRDAIKKKLKTVSQIALEADIKAKAERAAQQAVDQELMEAMAKEEKQSRPKSWASMFKNEQIADDESPKLTNDDRAQVLVMMSDDDLKAEVENVKILIEQITKERELTPCKRFLTAAQVWKIARRISGESANKAGDDFYNYSGEPDQDPAKTNELKKIFDDFRHKNAVISEILMTINQMLPSVQKYVSDEADKRKTENQVEAVDKMAQKAVDMEALQNLLQQQETMKTMIAAMQQTLATLPNGEQFANTVKNFQAVTNNFIKKTEEGVKNKFEKTQKVAMAAGALSLKPVVGVDDDDDDDIDNNNSNNNNNNNNAKASEATTEPAVLSKNQKKKMKKKQKESKGADESGVNFKSEKPAVKTAPKVNTKVNNTGEGTTALQQYEALLKQSSSSTSN